MTDIVLWETLLLESREVNLMVVVFLRRGAGEPVVVAEQNFRRGRGAAGAGGPAAEPSEGPGGAEQREDERPCAAGQAGMGGRGFRFTG